jgi:hypothetical protein
MGILVPPKLAAFNLPINQKKEKCRGESAERRGVRPVRSWSASAQDRLPILGSLDALFDHV